VIRRSVLVSGALAIALTLSSVLSSCSTFTANDNAASVDGHELSQNDLQLMLESDLGQSLLNDAPINGVIGAGSARGLINAWIQLTAFTEAGIGTDVDTAEIEANLANTQDSWTAAPQVMRDLAVKNIAIGTLRSQGGIDQNQVRTVLLAADVAVDSRYGRWDDETLSVVAFG
jgi:hypothetical protein